MGFLLFSGIWKAPFGSTRTCGLSQYKHKFHGARFAMALDNILVTRQGLQQSVSRAWQSVLHASLEAACQCWGASQSKDVSGSVRSTGERSNACLLGHIL